MTREYLGLYDTPPDRHDVRFSLAVVAFLFAFPLALLPVREVPLGPIHGFVPTFNAATFVCDLIIGVLLYAQARVFRSRALVILASGYILIALLLVAHTLTFPGAFDANGWLKTARNTTAWLAFCRRLAFPIAIIFYALLKRADAALPEGTERPAFRVLPSLAGAIAIAMLTTGLVTLWHDWLPPLFFDQNMGTTYRSVVNWATIALVITAMTMLLRQTRSILDIWLLVALCSWIAQALLNLTLDARYTIGWYALFVMWLAGSLIILIALITEFHRLQARLALSMAAREREHEVRLMSVDALTAAIAHEVGQPLSAVNLNAAAGLNWLGREPPNIDAATEALRGAMDAGHRAFDVIKSIRATFFRGWDGHSEFSINDLIDETTSLLAKDMATQKVSLRLDLDPELPPIEANRVQLQRVLVNLLTNAIESLASTRRSGRRIEICSSPTENRQVLVEIRDTGAGIPPDKMALIFEPFFTTKKTGTGLGLSLCRSIVEEHGGRLWVSAGDDGGACFNLQLPYARAA